MLGLFSSAWPVSKKKWKAIKWRRLPLMSRALPHWKQMPSRKDSETSRRKCELWYLMWRLPSMRLEPTCRTRSSCLFWISSITSKSLLTCLDMAMKSEALISWSGMTLSSSLRFTPSFSEKLNTSRSRVTTSELYRLWRCYTRLRSKA